MADRKTASGAHPAWGWICILLGLYPITTALGLLPLNDDAIFVPVWVLFLCGILFVFGGAMILLGRHAAINDLLAMVFCLSAGMVGAWISLFGSSAQISGGLPFLPRDYNVVLARVLFGIGALVTFAIAAYAFRCYRRRR